MTALDVGAGLGHGMRSLAEAGFDTWGIEPTKRFREIAIREVDPARLAPATLEEADFPAGSFDFITFGAVLEHLFSPSDAIERAMTWLKPGGILHVEVPHAPYLISKMLNLYFRLRGTNYVTFLSPMHPPFHLYEFTLRSFRKYRIAEHRFDVCNTPYFPTALRPLIEWLMKRTNTEMQLTVYLRR
jgi:2-polyprenyl-3-methyl-5-hydroxy-6-metoxy-1,4-benzoquinol methylase